MKEIFSKQYKISLRGILSERVDIPHSGIYIFEIRASAKSWRQNTWSGRSFFRKDSLTLRVNGVLVGGSKKRKRLRADDFWNGNVLKGHDLVLFATYFLQKGEASYSFDISGAPYLESVVVYTVPDSEITLNNLTPSHRDRAPWLTWVGHEDISIFSLAVRVRVDKKKENNDDDDLQLRIDEIIEKNQDKKAHKDWYWCGKVLNGKEHTFERTFAPTTRPHRIEFWADGIPIINTMIIRIGENGNNDENEGMRARVIWESAAVRMEPRQESTLLKEAARGSEVTVIQRAVKGDRPVNANNQPLFSNRWHQIFFNGTTGYIYSEALEIHREDEESIRKIIYKRSKEFGRDPCLMLAIAKRESRLIPYMVSEDEAQGLFQLRDIAIRQISETFKKNITTPFDIEQSIEAGILYFNYLFDHYTGADHQIERALAAWNWGIDNVPKIQKYSRKNLPQETKAFIEQVLEDWKQCKQINTLRMISVIAGIIVLAPLLLWGISTYSIVQDNSPEQKEFFAFLDEEWGGFSTIEERIIDFDNNGDNEHFLLVRSNREFPGYAILMRRSDRTLVPIPEISEGIISWFVGDVNKNEKPDVLIHFGYSGSGGFGSVIVYEWDQSKFHKIFYRTEPGGTFILKDMDGFMDDELLFFYKKSKWEPIERMEIYDWVEKKDAYILVDENECEGRNCLNIKNR